jgi:phage-related protein
MFQIRPVSWIKAARKAFDAFPDPVRRDAAMALVVASQGGMPRNAKPLKGLGSGVLELVLNDGSGTYRVVYALQIADELWVIHAFQKKSTHGIKTASRDIDIVRQRLRQLREEYQ